MKELQNNQKDNKSNSKQQTLRDISFDFLDDDYGPSTDALTKAKSSDKDVILYSHDVSSIQNDSQYLEEDIFENDDEAELLSQL